MGCRGDCGVVVEWCDDVVGGGIGGVCVVVCVGGVGDGGVDVNDLVIASFDVRV